MKNEMFNFQPTIQGSTLNLRPLCAADYTDMYLCASDKRIWQGHPAIDRYQEPIFKLLFKDAIESKACLVISEKGTDKIVGWSRYYVGDDHPQDIAIGHTFLCCEHWGGTSNKELKYLMLKHAFSFYERVWFHVSPINIRSQKAVLKLGSQLIDSNLELLAGKQGPWQSYLLERDLNIT